MTALAGRWHECVATDTSAGSFYAFRLENGMVVPDPASRANPGDVHAPMVVDPLAFEWQDADWPGRPWEQAVIYELHVGTFTPQGSFAAVIDRLDELADLGVTAIELMPVAEFPGRRSWGYDGVLPFAPDAAYGSHEDLKRLVQAAHARGWMMLLDVVYDHFGPAGNYLHLCAPQFGRAGGPRLATAQWNDDLHHALYVPATGETSGRYADYADAPLTHLGRPLAQGFAYQGEPSPYRGGSSPSSMAPCTCSRRSAMACACTSSSILRRKRRCCRTRRAAGSSMPMALLPRAGRCASPGVGWSGYRSCCERRDD